MTTGRCHGSYCVSNSLTSPAITHYVTKLLTARILGEQASVILLCGCHLNNVCIQCLPPKCSLSVPES